MNLSHTLASNETKQQTSILAEKNLLQTKKLNILHHTTDKRRIERSTVTGKQKVGNGKMQPDNLRKTDDKE